MSEPDFTLPANGLVVVKKIILAYYKSGASKAPVKLDDVVERSGIHLTTISGNNAFLLNAGFLQKLSATEFQFTEMGTKYAEGLDSKDDAYTREALQTILGNYRFVQNMLDFIDIQGSVSKDEFSKHLSKILEVPLKKHIKTGINCFFDLLLEADLLIKEDNTFQRTPKVKKLEVPHTEKAEIPAITPPAISPAPITGVPATISTPSVPLTIQLNIDSSTSNHQIKFIFAEISKLLGKEPSEKKATQE